MAVKRLDRNCKRSQQRMTDYAEGAKLHAGSAGGKRGLATSRSACNGLEIGGETIDQRYLGPRAEIAAASGRARVKNSLCDGGLSRGGPPKPPSARQNVVCMTVAISSPVALSVILRSV